MGTKEVKITETTRCNIFDELRIKKIVWHGSLSEIEFLNRVFDLKKKPSNDYRLADMEKDISQHRGEFFDWEDDWVFGDPRLNLLGCEDQVFLKFLCEMIHPLVRSDESEVKILLDIFNKHLKNDGFKIVIQKHVSGKPVFHGISSNEFSVPFENIEKVGREFIKEQVKKCEDKLSEGDFDGVVTNARSLLESAMRDIYKKIKGKDMQSKGDLIKDFKEIKKLLYLEDMNQLISGLTSTVNGIATMSNKMADRHDRENEPERHHAKLAFNSVKTVVDFLYDASENLKDAEK